MTYTKKIVCLANSRKVSGRCIAGREISNGNYGPWVRPVSERPEREISEVQRRYEDGTRAIVLDIIDIPLHRHVPRANHVEDHLNDDDYYWQKTGRADWAMLEALVEEVNGPLWVNTASTYHGENDKLTVCEAAALDSSIMLIKPINPRIEVLIEDGFGGRPGKRVVRLRFRSAGHNYFLKVTDPKIETDYLQRNDGVYPLNDAIVCVSMSEPWNDLVIKLVAGIFTPDMV